MPPKASLNVSLTPELMAYVEAPIAGGGYRTASEVIRAGLRLLQRGEIAQTDQPQGRLTSNSSSPPPGQFLALNRE